MDFVIRLLPGALTGIIGFGTLVVISGNYCRRRFRHGWKLLAGYVLVVGVLWAVCLVGGSVLTWPVIKQNGHAAMVVFLIPYVITTLPIAAVALMKYGWDLLSRSP